MIKSISQDRNSFRSLGMGLKSDRDEQDEYTKKLKPSKSTQKITRVAPINNYTSNFDGMIHNRSERT